jgi:hypothetical protein
MKRIIEVFTAGCPLCNPVVELVKSTACSSCDIITHNLTETEAGNPALRRARCWPAARAVVLPGRRWKRRV